MELVDVLDSKSSAARRAGSSPATGTTASEQSPLRSKSGSSKRAAGFFVCAPLLLLSNCGPLRWNCDPLRWNCDPLRWNCDPLRWARSLVVLFLRSLASPYVYIEPET